MTQGPGQQLGRRLEELKRRSGRSYTALAKRTGISRSSLHRYCQGLAVPEAFGTVESIARACDASRSEALTLHQLWAAARVPACPPEPAAASSGSGLVAPRAAADTQLAAPAPAPASASASAEQRPGGGSVLTATLTARPLDVVNRSGPERSGRSRAAVVVAACVVLTLVVGAVFVGARLLGWPGSGRRSAVPQQIFGPQWRDAPTPVPADFFGVTINSSTGAMPGFQVGAVRLWDSGTSWARLEPQRGSFDWTTLDRLVAGAKRAGLPVLLTFGATPLWASPAGPPAPYDDGSRASPPDDLGDWDAFVSAVATRYRDRVDAYELWNLAPSPQFFTGSAQRLAEMTRRASRILRADAPGSTVVCPGMGDLWQPASRRFMLDFARAGGYQYCDVAAMKLHQKDFGQTPESIVQLTDLIDGTMRSAGLLIRKWNTGTAYRIATAKRLDQETAVDYAVRFYLVGLYTRYERMYFYNWGGSKLPIVLQPVGGEPTQAALFVAQLQRWLTGADITECGHGVFDRLPANVWECRFLLPASGAKPGPGTKPNPDDGPDSSATAEPAVIRWTESGHATMRAEPGIRSINRLDGSDQVVRPGDRIEITGRPILLRYQPQQPGSAQGE